MTSQETTEPSRIRNQSKRQASNERTRNDDGQSSGGLQYPFPPKDPTQNVIDSLNAAIERIDDISALENRSLREIINEKIARVTDIMHLRAEYHKELAAAESKRIDAIRLVDVNAVSIANERATLQAATLQNQVAQSAEALRALVATTATTVAQQLAQTTAQITDRLSVLERAQYEFKGSSSIADPATANALSTMAGAIEKLSTTATREKGATEGGANVWAIIAGVFAALWAISGTVVAVIEITKH